MLSDTMVCPSTHGADGYAPYTYWDGEAIRCGICGADCMVAPWSDTAVIFGKRGVPWVGPTPLQQWVVGWGDHGHGCPE